VQRIGIRLRVNRDGRDAEFTARADNAHGDFAAIGYEYFLEHRSIFPFSVDDVATPDDQNPSCPWKVQCT
jgi:hypothetical protein